MTTATPTLGDRVLDTTRQGFDHESLTALLNGDVHAVRLAGFVRPDALDHLRKAFVGRQDHGPLATDPQFRRIGHAFSETSTDAGRGRYFDEARDNIDRLRDIASPYSYPADDLRLLLDEIWPAGASLLRRNGQAFFAGVARYQLAGVDLEPHTDNVGRNLPSDFDIRITRQLSVNVYLDVPERGGELQIWDDYPDEREYRDRSGDRVYGIDRAAVGDPALVITPRVGDAIFIDPRRVHAVAPSQDRPRITIGLFIGVTDPAASLKVWS
ncbi:2OG-Fe(II) oxygenase [Nocardia sp. CS682]|uniref:2OG-Fe(II) oxygenase n=1 Tax=Nocardia sp. CS682 TaxID=1047172 RepID=UPI0014317598|nr:2OG-Fe(II) oxygenase [Nocardia sp. CS682]